MTQPRARVRLIEAAAHDLTMLIRSDPQIVRQVLKRLLYIERARAESAIYAEMTRRVATLPKNPQTIALGDVIESLGRTAMGLRVEEQQSREPLPEWLLSRLVYTAGFARREVESLDAEAAMELWERYITSGDIRDDAGESPT